MMTPSEWLNEALLHGSTNISDSDLSELLPIANLPEETLWILFILLSGCFSDLGKAGAITSLPANLDLQAAESIFTHLSSMMADAAVQLKEHGSEVLESQEYVPLTPRAEPSDT